VKNLSFKSKLMLLIGVSAMGLLAVATMGLSTLQNIKLDGNVYKSIKLEEDIVADYVPPSEGISYIVTILVDIEEAPDRATIEDNIKAFHQARQDFEDRHTYYMANVPDGKLKELMAGSCYSTAHQWFEIAENEFLPAIAQSNFKEAHNIRVKKLTPLYLQHARSINEIVRLAGIGITSQEQIEGSFIAFRTRLIVGVSIAILTALMGLGYMMMRGILKPLGRTLIALEAVAAGDLQQHLVVDSSDEIGGHGPGP